MAEKTRYSDAELEEFRALINQKLEQANADYEVYRKALNNVDGNDINDTSPTFKVLEDGAAASNKEEIGRSAQHLMKFIQNLQNTLLVIMMNQVS